MTISWIAALFFLLVSIVFLILWLRARNGSSAAGGTTAMLCRPGDAFEAEQQYVLLGSGQTSGAGSASSFGAARGPDGEAFAFLIGDSIAHLNAGDTFQLKNGQLYKVRQSGAPTAAAYDDDKTEVVGANMAAAAPPPPAGNAIDDGMTVMVSAAQTEALWHSQVEEALPTLEVLEGVDSGTRFFLPFDVTTIGRSESNGVALREEGSSRVHCEIEFIRPNFVIRDLQSTNGTLLNGAPIDVAVLAFGDAITISDTVMEFGCKGYSLSEHDSEAAIAAFEQCLDAEPDFLPAVKNLAFLLERDIRRKKEAQPLWDQVAKLEKLAGG